MNSHLFEESNLNDQGFWLALLLAFATVYYFFAFQLLVSQDGYTQSKWDARIKNEKKARDRKDYARRKKLAREKENKDKKRLHKQMLKSQFGISGLGECKLEFSEWFFKTFSKYWLMLHEVASDFNLSFPLPDLSSFEFEKSWHMIKESEICEELCHLFRMMISLGFMKKIEVSLFGKPFFNSEPLRQHVTVPQLLEKIVIFYKLIKEKIFTALEVGDFRLFFQSAVKNAYDDEFTFIKSHKARIDLGRENEVDIDSYDRRVHECIEATLSSLNTCKDNERAYYSSRLAILKDIQTSRVLSMKEGVRIKPYGILLFGGSGVGKSAIANGLTRYILKVNNFDSSPRAVTSLNMEDKYQSEFASHHKGVIFDDLCNTSLDRVQGSPTLPVIMFLNNMTMAALNANADMKGKVMIEPMVVVATTNVKQLLSNQLSNEPLSINRRFNVTITQKVKPEYCKKDSTMLDPAKIMGLPDSWFPDYALFTVEEPDYVQQQTGDHFVSGKTRAIKFQPIIFEGEELKDVGVEKLLNFLRHDSALHFSYQKRYVDIQRGMNEISLCKCQLPTGMCKICPLESQAGVPSLAEVTEFLSALEIRFIACLNRILHSFLYSPQGHFVLVYLMRGKLKEIVSQSLGYYILSIILTLFFDWNYHVHGSWLVVYFTFIYLAYVYTRFRLMRRSIIESLTIPLPSTYLRNLNWRIKIKIIYFLTSIGFWAILIKLAKNWKKLPVAQAAEFVTLEPDAKPWQKDTEFWDVHARERQYQFGDAGVSEKSRTITIANFTNLIGNRLMIAYKENGMFCNVVPLKSNVLLIPNHVVTSKTEFVTLVKVGGHTFKNMPLDNKVALRIPGTDFAIWYCPGAGLHRDITDYYPKDIEEGKKLEVFTIYNDEGKLVKFPNMMINRSQVITTQGGIFPGYKYLFPKETFGGLCMATLVGNVKGIPFIAGHHLAGRGTTGAAGILTRKMIEETITKLDERPCVLVSHSATAMTTRSMNIEFGPLVAPHEKCITRGLGLESKLRIHGGHSNVSRSSPKSAVVTSVISEVVKEVMSIEKKHGPPKEMDSIRHKELDIGGKIDTATQFDSELLNKAVIDYDMSLKSIPESELVKVGKISDDVNLAGLDGVLGINAMNFSTSIGFPGQGAKTQFVSKSDRFVKGISCPRDVDPMILDEISKMESQLLVGNSINAVFKASLKDEPTKMTKDKVRVFAAANMPFVMLVRKYFLSLAALVQRNKIATECAVGTIVQSPEWTELYQHIGKHGWDRAIAGDYAKFDGRMSPQFMLAAFKLLIKIAERSGNYDVDDLTIMRGIASEISYPTYDYFGTLVQFMGSNPSGHPLTVVINSFVNSLYLRYCWYAIAREKRWWKVPIFNTKVSAMTYGDDNIMTVAKGYDDFNHTAIADQLAKVSIKYTMADKDAPSVPFISLQEASFLKHFAVWDDELNLYRSPVEEDSIAKMLHTHLKSKVLTMEQSSAEAIQNVALKYFEFGREVYTMRRKQLEEVASRVGIQSYVGPILSYDERLAWYREKFDL